MTKVKVSKRIAKFIENYERSVSGCSGWEETLLAEHCAVYVEGFPEKTKDEAKCMRSLSPLELAEILLNGYEIELTPEESLLEEYNDCQVFDTAFERGIRRGIEITLSKLNVKIAGIN